ncbi:prohead core protein [Escherichia phage Lw1]|uniref:Gp68 prohead core protein n=2 Tax=Pseudotevenvirus TaxID=2842979 RepID=D9ICS2_BPRB1|nr:head scaffolding protein [Escherichia phage RB16]YP_008060735.1 head scaffolding protein [Escherichia phage Lw1]ADJ55515.1 gp68 prohead core protein [Escherichia phage RB16]AGJ71620.1 prohead core protein [Escherichia phage Lw1]
MQLELEDISTELIEPHLTEAKARVDILGIDEGTIKIIENLAVDEPHLALAMMSIVEGLSLDEVIVKHVDSRGNVERKKDRKTRERNAYQTTGLTKSQRRQIARRAMKTKRANPSITTRAQRKRKKALRKRAALGL